MVNLKFSNKKDVRGSNTRPLRRYYTITIAITNTSSLRSILCWAAFNNIIPAEYRAAVFSLSHGHSVTITDWKFHHRWLYGLYHICWRFLSAFVEVRMEELLLQKNCGSSIQISGNIVTYSNGLRFGAMHTSEAKHKYYDSTCTHLIP